MPKSINVPEDPVDLAEAMARRGLADGLPVVPPTRQRVDEMLGDARPDSDATLGWMPPAWGAATRFHIAVNAVMAGCRPEHFPVVLAAVRALLKPEFNLYGIQVTTNPVAPLLIVHGPVAEELGINGGQGAFGPGRYANAVIGRAIRLVLMNVGGGLPSDLDRSTQGQPGKYTSCVAENEAASPWPAFHLRRGIPEGHSAVTVFAAQAYHNVARLSAQNADELLDLLAGAMAAPGTNNMTYGGEVMLALPPDNARLLDRAGYGPASVQRYLFERARLDATQLAPELRAVIRERRPGWIEPHRVPVVDEPEGIHVLVVGGPGGHSQFLPSFGPTVTVTEPLEGSGASIARA
jgi:hypothetical protein